MNKSITFADYLTTSIIAAIAYCIPLVYFFKNEIVTNSWVLYIGNIFFALVIVIAATLVNRKIHDETSIVKMVAIGVKLTIVSIIITIPFVVALFYLFGNHIIPSSTANNSSNTSLLMLLMNLLIVNIFLGSFVVVLAAIIYNKYPKNSKGQEIT